MLTSEEAARRLGVKVATLYAYVSRGLVESHPAPVGRGSVFALADVEALADRSRGGRRTEMRLATVTTSVTQLRPGDGPCYRGRPAVELAGRVPFEDVCALLWEAEGDKGDWSAPDLGPCPVATTADALRWALVLVGATDPLRSDLRPVSVTRAARRVVAALVDAVSTGSVGSAGAGSAGAGSAGDLRTGGAARETTGGTVACCLADHLVGGSAPVGVADAVDAALVLMADHELATSTMAVRMAASVRADLYDALAAGLATLAGPLHGGASQGAYELLVVAERDGASRALTDVLREQGHLPGFGHRVYADGDPRVPPLLASTFPLLDDERRALVDEVLAVAAAAGVPAPNADLAIAVLAWGTGMASDAGRTIFSVARVAGWTAHYLEELGERPLRFRGRAVYGTPPGRRSSWSTDRP